MLKRFIETPEDRDPSFIGLVRNILIFTIVATVVSAVVIITTSNTPGLVVTLTALAGSGSLELIALFYAMRGKILLAKTIVPAALVITITVIALSANSIHDISIIAYPMIIVIAVLIQGRRALILTTPLAVAAIILLGVLDQMGLTRSPLAWKTGPDDPIIGAVLIITSSAILNLLISRFNRALARAEANEQAQIEANLELKKLQVSLEQRVQDRTSELSERGQELETANEQIRKRAGQFEAIAQVTQSITSIRDLQELLPRIATVISETFGFYHVGVFMMDATNEYAVLSATNSPGGLQMMQRGHRLRVGAQGIVGYVTATGSPRIAMDVGKDAVFFDNLELAGTHSEMALPLTSGNRVIGALDVQSTEQGAFTEEDVQMLSLLANQVSLAIENARLFDETRRALAEAQSISRQALREAWGKLPTEQNIRGYRYTPTGAVALEKPVDQKRQPEGGDIAKSTEPGRVVVPIELRGETIGTLVVQTPSRDGMNDNQMDLIRAVAERVAISAENARLFDETTRRAERERLVSDITGKIRSVNDPQSMIETAMEELRKALGASRVEVVPQSVKGAEQGS
jgi:GAF domain-containing protein